MTKTIPTDQVRLFLSAIVLSMIFSPLALPAQNTAPSSTAAPTIDKAFISYRIGVAQWMVDERFDELVKMFDRHPGMVDEITLFQSFVHSPIPLEEVRRRMQIAKQRMAVLRQHGYRSGINVLTTMGHHEEDLPHMVQGDFTPVTDIHGNVSRGSLCPNDPDMREYIAELYRIVAAAAPDYIWIDDDVRLAGHMPVGQTCFCNNCLKIFAEETGTSYTREELAAAFVTGTEAERLALRRAWLNHNRATIARLFTLIEQTVHEQKPGLPLGFMTGDRFYEGYDFDHWAEILSGPQGADVYWRPGGGFYSDQWIPGMAQKSHDVGRQVSVLPMSVVSIQSEIENFPYHRLKKSAHITAVEAASHIGAGCTGAAFNVLSGNDEPLDEFAPIVERVARMRPFYDLLVRHLGRHSREGVFPLWCKDTAAGSDLAGGNWTAFGGFLSTHGPSVLEIGLPACYRSDAASVTLISGDMAAPLSEEEIRKLLSGGVYMDAYALDWFNAHGYGDLTGFTVERSLDNDCLERLNDHPLNGPYAGRVRDSRQSFNKWPAAVLKKTGEKAASLSSLVDYTDAEVAPCTMGVFENQLGGRICVAGYFPWSFLHNQSKSSQMKSVLRWLSRDTLPAYVESFHMANLWVVQPEEGTLAVTLTNSSFDPAEGLTLMLRTPREEITVYDMDCRAETVRGSGTDGPYRRFVLPAIAPWEMRLITAGMKE